MGRRRLEASTAIRWEPKTWKPRYDMVVYKHCLGYDNNRIATETGLHFQTVSNILGSLQGRARVKIIQDKLLTNVNADLGQRLMNVAEKFMAKIERVAEDEELFTKSPFAVIDRGLQVLKGVGHLKSAAEGSAGSGSGGPTPNHTTFIGKAVILSDDAAKNLRDAIALSDEVKEIHEHRPFELISGGAEVRVKSNEKAS